MQFFILTPSIGQCLFEGFVLRLEFGDQLGELGQVCAQSDGKYADSCFCIY